MDSISGLEARHTAPAFTEATKREDSLALPLETPLPHTRWGLRRPPLTHTLGTQEETPSLTHTLGTQEQPCLLAPGLERPWWTSCRAPIVPPSTSEKLSSSTFRWWCRHLLSSMSVFREHTLSSRFLLSLSAACNF